MGKKREKEGSKGKKRKAEVKRGKQREKEGNPPKKQGKKIGKKITVRGKNQDRGRIYNIVQFCSLYVILKQCM